MRSPPERAGHDQEPVTQPSATRQAAHRDRRQPRARIDRPKPAGVNAPASAATSRPTRCARSTSPISRSIPAPAIAACTTASSTISATSGRRCCSACTRKARSRSRMATPRSPARRWRRRVHSNVGLMHATMAIFNAWCDRMPMVILGATGPVDAVKRRPWIDWIHTARDQGALVRGYTKWDDQPASPSPRAKPMLRAGWIANTAPRGPTYVNLDAGMQEEKLAEPVTPIDAERFMPEVESAAAPRPCRPRRRAAARRQTSADPRRPRVAQRRRLEHAHRARRTARRPRRHRSQSRRRVSDRSPAACRRAGHHRADAGGRGRHPLRRCHPQPRLARRCRHAQTCRRQRSENHQVSIDHHLHNGWSMDYQALPPVDVMIACEPDAAVPPLLAALGPLARAWSRRWRRSFPFPPATS